MKMPGFTAETALYKERAFYLRAGTLIAHERTQALLPQACSHLVYTPDPYCGCYGLVGCEDEQAGLSYSVGRYVIPGCYCA